MFNLLLLWFGALARMFRGRRHLILENLGLRWQFTLLHAINCGLVAFGTGRLTAEFGRERAFLSYSSSLSLTVGGSGCPCRLRRALSRRFRVLSISRLV